MILETVDKAASVEVDNTDFRRLYFYCPALFLILTEYLASRSTDPDYEPKFRHFLNEMLGDQYGHSFKDVRELAHLINRHDPLDVDRECEVDFAALPDQPGEIPYDDLLFKIQGAVHGMLYFMTAPASGFYSPGQVVDIAQFFEYIETAKGQVGPGGLRSAIDRLTDFFQKAKVLGMGVFQREVPE